MQQFTLLHICIKIPSRIQRKDLYFSLAENPPTRDQVMALACTQVLSDHLVGEGGREYAFLILTDKLELHFTIGLCRLIIYSITLTGKVTSDGYFTLLGDLWRNHANFVLRQNADAPMAFHDLTMFIFKNPLVRTTKVTYQQLVWLRQVT